MPLYGASAEYALHTVLNLALASGSGAPSARDLADFQRLPLAFMRKLLTRLEKAGIVAASEGVRGGWRLARGPAEVTLLDVADAAQGRERLFECRDIRAHCALWPEGSHPSPRPGDLCSIHAAMLAAEEAMRRELGGRTIAALAEEVARKSPAWAGRDLPGWFNGRDASRRSQTAPEQQE